MGLSSALNIGRSALSFAQAALQVTGNNMANATTPGYSRNTVNAAPVSGTRLGNNAFVGNGVNLNSVQRQIDLALQARIRDALGDENYASTQQSLISQIESLQNELTKSDISSGLSEFFDSWSELANTPSDPSVQSLVVQQGSTLASQMQDLRNGYVDVRDQIDNDLTTQVSKADDILSQIAQLNLSIVQSEQGQGTNASLRDQRDNLVNELSKYMDVSVVEQPAGTYDVFVGSTPVVLGTESRGVELDTKTVDGEKQVSVRVKTDGATLDISTGSIGADLTARSDIVDNVIDSLDSVASSLIYEVNRIHSQGQGTNGLTSVTGTYTNADPAAALDDPATGLPFPPHNGSFEIRATRQSDQVSQDYRIDVDLDGIGSDMSLEDLASAINSEVGSSVLTASVTVDGRLSLTAADGYQMTFSNDTSGVLASLGVNTYFTGTNAGDIAVNEDLADDPSLVATGKDNVPGSNGTALDIADLKNAPVNSLNGVTIPGAWTNSVESLAVQSGAINSKVQSTQLVRQSLEAQQSAVSGVSLDEESVNMINYQRQYEAAARFISVVSDLLQTLLNSV